MTEKFNFKYVYTPTGEIHGASFIQQTEDAVNDVGALAIDAKESADKTGADFADVVKRVDVAEAVSNNALSVANTANSKADTTTSVMETVREDVQNANGLSTQALEKARTAESNSASALAKATKAEQSSATAVAQSLEAVNSSAQSSSSALESATQAKAAQKKATEAKDLATSAEASARQSAQMAEEARDRIGTTLKSTAERMAQTWADGVLIYDTELDTLFCGDGVTAGGKKTGGADLPPDVVTTSKLEGDASTTIRSVKTESVSLKNSFSGVPIVLANSGGNNAQFGVLFNNTPAFSVGGKTADFHSRTLKGVDFPTAETDGANKWYVDRASKSSGVTQIELTAESSGSLYATIPTDWESDSVFKIDWPFDSVVDGEPYHTLYLNFTCPQDSYTKYATIKTLYLYNIGGVAPTIAWNDWQVRYNGDPTDLDFSGEKLLILTVLRVDCFYYVSPVFNGQAPAELVAEMDKYVEL